MRLFEKQSIGLPIPLPCVENLVSKKYNYIMKNAF